MKLYRIGEFAKQNGVSLDFIRYYEDAGALKSIVDEKNNYHYYEFSQCEIIFKIKLCRKLGFSSKETVKLLKDSTRQEVVSMLAEQAAHQREMAKASVYAANRLDRLKRIMETEDDTWYISHLPSIWFLPHTDDESFLSTPGVRAQLKRWEENMPYVFCIGRWILNPDGSLKMVQHGRAVVEADAEMLGIPTQAPALRFSEKRCIEYYGRLKHPDADEKQMELSLASIEGALAVVKDKNFVIDGDIFVEVFTMYKENESMQEKCIVYIPIV